MDAIMEKKTKTRGPWHPWRLRGVTQSTAAAHNIDDWMWDLDEGVSEKEVGKTDGIHTHNSCSACWRCQMAKVIGNTWGS